MLPPNSDWRVFAEKVPPKWVGDLDDDCTAHWAGFLLRAEWIDDDYWWWCVYKDGTDTPIASSDNGGERKVSTGEAARAAAERAVKRMLGFLPQA